MKSGFWDKRVSNSTGCGIVTALILGHTLLLPMCTSGRYLQIMTVIAGLFGVAAFVCYAIDKRKGERPSKTGIRLVVYTGLIYGFLCILPALL